MLTNFSLLTNEQKTAWSLDLWKYARNMSFVNQFLGKGSNSLVQHITELRKSEKGARAVLTLLTDLQGDGVAGDRTLEGNEEGLNTNDIVIRLDQLRHANRHEGRMADQKSVVEFRENSRDTLAYWLSDRIDQMAFLTMSGVQYSKTNAGANRIGSDLANLEFAADVVAPSSKRFARWNGSGKVLEWGGATTTVATGDTPMWEMFVQAKAYAKDNYMRGIKGDGNSETWHAFLSPSAMAKLKQDPTYVANLRAQTTKTGRDSELFTGDHVKIDGIVLHEFRHVYNTRLAPSGSKFGGSGTVDGCQILFCGAQSLGMADIGPPEWNEKGFDYDNQQGISTGKIFGFRKPQFVNPYSGSTLEDFGVLSLYCAQ
jgi:N4-gp56 family major capsid protein